MSGLFLAFLVLIKFGKKGQFYFKLGKGVGNSVIFSHIEKVYLLNLDFLLLNWESFKSIGKSFSH